MDPKVVLIVGAITTAWVMLSLIGNERRRKVIEWQATNPPKPQVGKDEDQGPASQAK